MISKAIYRLRDRYLDLLLRISAWLMFGRQPAIVAHHPSLGLATWGDRLSTMAASVEDFQTVCARGKHSA